MYLHIYIYIHKYIHTGILYTVLPVLVVLGKRSYLASQSFVICYDMYIHCKTHKRRACASRIYMCIIHYVYVIYL